MEPSEVMTVFEQTMVEMIENQTASLLKIARRITPTATSEDILQPNDYPQLENHPEFRYEEGVLAGMQSSIAALRYHLTKMAHFSNQSEF